MDKRIVSKITKDSVSAVDMAARLEKGSLCPVELVEETFANIRSSDPAIFTELLEERALKEAHASRQRRREGNPLSAWDGIPIAWKDLFDIEGRVTTAGSVVLKSNAPATRDADVVANATRAGLVSIGCLNMTEFAYSGLGLNPHFGTPKNPHGTGPDRIPGGSSSGCGVAVARGLVPLAIGSDTGGSIRIPAGLNGVVGYKGSSTAFPKGGTFPLSPTLDTFGPLAADLKSCIGVAEILNGRAVATPKPTPINQLNFFIPTNVVFKGAQEAVIQNFEAAARALELAGATVTRGICSEFDEIGTLAREHGYLVGPEALDLHWDLVHSERAAQMDPRVLDRILDAGDMSARDLLVILRARARLIQKNRQLLGDQIILFPTTPITAPELKPLEQNDDLYIYTNALMLRNTALGNFLDWCGVALPNGIDENQMPTSILLSMSGGRESDLLAAALSIENLLTQNLS
ncbi:amidase family protein [Psychrobacter sp. P11G5]|uniref:amidase family protein n=1 Tax=Psychrobacter sp. P11G5 TaxID=1699624 RepID=UPI000829A390|nr:amidase family protein [Psychrobacter sp. P11G5]